MELDDAIVFVSDNVHDVDCARSKLTSFDMSILHVAASVIVVVVVNIIIINNMNMLFLLMVIVTIVINIKKYMF